VVKSRKAWVAGLLSVLTLGVGHIYAGEMRKGLLLHFIPQPIIIVALLVIVLLFPTNNFMIAFEILFFLVCTYWFFCIVDSIKCTKRSKGNYVLKRYNRWYIYLFCIICAGFIIKPILKQSIRMFVFQAYKIPAGSMKPTFFVGDYFIAKQGLALGSKINRGDIVVFQYPKDPSKYFVKRVIELAKE